jgi:predicted ATPase
MLTVQLVCERIVKTPRVVRLLLNQIEVEGYRSIKDLWLKLSKVNVLVGPNGCGKSNLYRSLWLIHAAATGEFARAIANEGGMPSALWAGSRKGKARLKIAAKLGDMKYELQCGIPIPTIDGFGAPSMFGLDPEVKEEHVWYMSEGTKSQLLKRDGQAITARNEHGVRVTYPLTVSSSESVLSEVREPHKYPELSLLRQQFLQWRFYHQFRTDMNSPIRQPQVGVRTPMLRHDGMDLAAALQTIREVGDDQALDQAIDRAFPGAKLSIGNNDGLFSLYLHTPGFNRAFSAQELSDGTLQYLCLLAALMSPRPPALLALNEPETSIHPDLFEALAKLICDASRNSQLWITTHSRELADFILEFSGASPIELEKVNGATRIVGQRLTDDDDDD